MQLGDLTAHSVTATVPGSGRLDVHATHALNASIPGHGQIVYTGDPKTVDRIVSGSGAILRDQTSASGGRIRDSISDGPGAIRVPVRSPRRAH